MVAAVYGEMVVKRLRQYPHRAELLSENDSYEPIVINDAEDIYIWGVVVGSARVFS